MGIYRIYTFNNGDAVSHGVEAQYPQEALDKYLRNKYKASKQEVKIKKVGAPMQAAVCSDNITGYIVASTDATLNFYLAAVSTRVNNKERVYVRCKGRAKFGSDRYMDLIVYYPKNAKNAEEFIGEILRKLVDGGAISTRDASKTANGFYLWTFSAGGNDYDNPELYISIDNSTNMMQLNASNSYGRRYTKVTPITDGNSLMEALDFAEMLGYL